MVVLLLGHQIRQLALIIKRHMVDSEASWRSFFLWSGEVQTELFGSSWHAKVHWGWALFIGAVYFLHKLGISLFYMYQVWNHRNCNLVHFPGIKFQVWLTFRTSQAWTCHEMLGKPSFLWYLVLIVMFPLKNQVCYIFQWAVKLADSNSF